MDGKRTRKLSAKAQEVEIEKQERERKIQERARKRQEKQQQREAQPEGLEQPQPSEELEQQQRQERLDRQHGSADVSELSQASTLTRGVSTGPLQAPEGQSTPVQGRHSGSRYVPTQSTRMEASSIDDPTQAGFREAAMVRRSQAPVTGLEESAQVDATPPVRAVSPVQAKSPIQARSPVQALSPIQAARPMQVVTFTQARSPGQASEQQRGPSPSIVRSSERSRTGSVGSTASEVQSDQQARQPTQRGRGRAGRRSGAAQNVATGTPTSIIRPSPATPPLAKKTDKRPTPPSRSEPQRELVSHQENVPPISSGVDQPVVESGSHRQRRQVRRRGPLNRQDSQEGEEVVADTRNVGPYYKRPFGRGITPDGHSDPRANHQKHLLSKAFKGNPYPRIQKVVKIPDYSQRGLTLIVRFEGDDETYPIEHFELSKFPNGPKAAQDYLLNLKASTDPDDVAKFNSLIARKAFDFTGYHIFTQF